MKKTGGYGVRIYFPSILSRRESRPKCIRRPPYRSDKVIEFGRRGVHVCIENRLRNVYRPDQTEREGPR